VHLLLKLSALLSDLNLNIREAHVFSTIDGFCLDVFVVDGWPMEVLSLSLSQSLSLCTWTPAGCLVLTLLLEFHLAAAYQYARERHDNNI